jgi:isoquinoline 1-oxidoreductase alpha subunit
MSITLTVNGSPQTFNGDPEMPLLWVLRDQLRLTGTKYGCGAGLCGACTVMIGGAAQRACQVSAKDAAGQEITTIEGLNGKVADAVQLAWVALDVVQCGYCQSGQVMSAAALLTTNTNPSDADIDAAMDGNICRCATYHRIRQAVHVAAKTLEG